MVQLALKRLTPKEAYDRVYRMRRAFQVNQPRISRGTVWTRFEWMLTVMFSARSSINSYRKRSGHSQMMYAFQYPLTQYQIHDA